MPLSDEITDHDGAGSYPSPDGQLKACAQLRNHPREVNPSANRPFSVVFMCLRITKVREYTFCHVASHVAAKFLDGGFGRILVRAINFTKFLGIEGLRKFSRTDEITEHQRQLTPLSISDRRRARAGALCRLA